MTHICMIYLINRHWCIFLCGLWNCGSNNNNNVKLENNNTFYGQKWLCKWIHISKLLLNYKCMIEYRHTHIWVHVVVNLNMCYVSLWRISELNHEHELDKGLNKMLIFATANDVTRVLLSDGASGGWWSFLHRHIRYLTFYGWHIGGNRRLGGAWCTWCLIVMHLWASFRIAFANINHKKFDQYLCSMFK